MEEEHDHTQDETPPPSVGFMGLLTEEQKKEFEKFDYQGPVESGDKEA